jgi:hypothetical protein
VTYCDGVNQPNNANCETIQSEFDLASENKLLVGDGSNNCTMSSQFQSWTQFTAAGEFKFFKRLLIKY